MNYLSIHELKNIGNIKEYCFQIRGFSKVMLLSGTTPSLVVDERDLSRWTTWKNTSKSATAYHVRYLLRRLLALQEATGYEILQKQGQRIFGGPPPDWTGSPPGRGTEIYCYRIPRWPCWNVLNSLLFYQGLLWGWVGACICLGGENLWTEADDRVQRHQQDLLLCQVPIYKTCHGPIYKTVSYSWVRKQLPGSSL